MNLHEQLTAAMAKAKALMSEFEGKALPKEKQTELDGYLVEAENLQEQIKQANRLADLEKFNSAPVTHIPLNGEAKNRETLRVIGDEDDRFLASPDGKWKSFGEQLQAVQLAATPGIMHQHVDKRLVVSQRIETKQTGMSEGAPAAGGFLVQQDFASELFKTAYEEGEMLSRIRRVPIGATSNGLLMNAIAETNRTTGNRWGGIQGYWLAEAGVKTASYPTLRQMEWNLRKLAVLVYATDELLQDATALGALITDAASSEIRWLVEESIMNGLGGGQPLGIMGHASLVTQAAEAGQAAATIVYENIVNMYSRRWPGSTSKMVWFINQDIEPQLMAMNAAVGAGGQMVWMPPGGLSGAPYGTLMGKPVISSEHTATLGTTGDICLFDLSQYLEIDKGGIQSASSIHVNFVYDETVFRFVFRVDGQPLWNNVLTPANSAITQSPFVVLATRP